MKIPYLKQGGPPRQPIRAVLTSSSLNSAVKILTSAPNGQKSTYLVSIGVSEDEFETVGGTTSPRFPINIQAVATELRKLNRVGKFTISEDEDGLLVQKHVAGSEPQLATDGLFSRDVTGGLETKVELSVSALAKDEAAMPMHALGLPSETVSSLERHGRKTIADFVDWGGRGKIPALSRATDETQKLCAETISILKDAVTAEGRIDWDRYAKLRGFELVPTNEADGPLLFGQLERIFRRLIPDDRSWHIIHGLYLLPETQSATLDEIGKGLKVTRERVRQIPLSDLVRLREMFLSDNYCDVQIRIRSSLAEAIKDLYKSLAERKPPILRLDEWLKALLPKCGEDLACSLVMLKLLPAIFEWKLKNDDGALFAYYTGDEIAAKPYNEFPCVVPHAILSRAQRILRGLVDADDYLPSADEAELRARTARLLRHRLERPEGNPNPSFEQKVQLAYQRIPTVRAWVRQQANGRCELCGADAPFLDDNNDGYLEVHHVQPLSDGGGDTPDNAVALCPNCHRRCHHSKDRAAQIELLYGRIGRLKRRPGQRVSP